MKKWIYKPGHPKASAHGFVAIEDLGEWKDPRQAKDAPIMSGRFYENTSATDGEDIGSRKRYREYMKRHGVTNSSDFSGSYYEKVKKEREHADANDRREAIARATWEAFEGRK